MNFDEFYERFVSLVPFTLEKVDCKMEATIELFVQRKVKWDLDAKALINDLVNQNAVIVDE